MGFLGQYEVDSGHTINKHKSCFIVGDKMVSNRVHAITNITGFVKKALPIKYLGCMLFK